MYLEKFDEANKKVKKTEEIPSMLGKRSKNDKEEEKEPIEPEGESNTKRLKESEAYKSLFKPMYEENKDTDFLCRNVHRGLR